MFKPFCLVSIFAVLTMASAHASCPVEFPSSGICASIDWRVGPVQGDESRMIVRFWNAANSAEAGPYVDPAPQIDLKPWMGMGDHGHGTSPVRVTRLEPGVFQVDRIYLVMSGAWELRIQRKDGARVLEQAVTSVDVP